MQGEMRKRDNNVIWGREIQPGGTRDLDGDVTAEMLHWSLEQNVLAVPSPVKGTTVGCCPVSPSPVILVHPFVHWSLAAIIITIKTINALHLGNIFHLLDCWLIWHCYISGTVPLSPQCSCPVILLLGLGCANELYG